MTQEEVKKRFDHDIRDHFIEIIIDKDCNRVIKCSRGKSWTFGFYVVTSPGSIYIYGDMGSLGVERHPDMFEFVRGADDISYFLSKCPREFSTKVYNPELVEKFIKKGIYDNYDKEIEKDLQKINSIIEDLELCDLENEYEVYQCLYNSAYYDDFMDFPYFKEYDWKVLWLVNAMRWCVKKYDEHYGQF